MGCSCYRFSQADELAVTARLVDVVAGYVPLPSSSCAVTLDALERIGAGAVGCSVYSLRGCELEWIRTRARAVLVLEARKRAHRYARVPRTVDELARELAAIDPAAVVDVVNMNGASS